MQQRKKFTWAALGATLLAAGMIMPMAHAQSSDALLDKLVDKGYLTVKEANDLREQTDEGFQKAYHARTGLPDWVNQVKLYGDVRGRMELFRFENDAPGAGEPNKDRTRYRYRLRVGATVQMKDNFELGFRLTSSEAQGTFGGDPISGNTTAQDNGSKKFVYVDTAYGKWTPINSGPWLLSGTIGKMENPFLVSDMVFDADYTPEGAAIQAGYAINSEHSLKLSGGVFILDEINQGATASEDPYMLGVQLRYDAKWTPQLTTTAGVGWYGVTHDQTLGNANVPNVNVGNTRFNAAAPGHVAGDLVNSYHPIVADLGVTYTVDKVPLYPGPFPIRLAGEVMHNPGADEDNNAYWAGIFFGKSGKKGTWEVSYRYKRLEADAWFEEFTDSDFGAYYQTGSTPAGFGQGAGYRAGTGVKGHVVKAVYSVSDSFTFGITYFLTDLINPKLVASGDHFESGQHRVQIDAIWKF
jgi:hypothetical protein